MRRSILEPASVRRLGWLVPSWGGKRDTNMLRIYDVMIQMAHEMRPVLARIESRDRDLGRQMRRAFTSMVLNTGEASGSCGGIRRERYRSALGSARETKAGLDVATALGYVEPKENKLELIINTLRKVAQ
jgi:four helix bundle protein